MFVVDNRKWVRKDYDTDGIAWETNELPASLDGCKYTASLLPTDYVVREQEWKDHFSARVLKQKK